MSEGLLEKELTHSVIGSAMEVHRTLGPGFLESVYPNVLAEEMSARGMRFERERPLRVLYKGAEVGCFEADFSVDGKVIVELKAAKGLSEVDEAQIINYLRASGIRVGLLFNFGNAPLLIAASSYRNL